LENGVVYLFNFDKDDYDNLYVEQKALAYSHLVKLTWKEKQDLFLELKNYKRYIVLLKRYLNYVYSAAVLCKDKNFLHKDFGMVYGNLGVSPYIVSLRILREKIAADNINEIAPIVDKLLTRMKRFASYTDAQYKSNFFSFLESIAYFYSDLQKWFFHVLLKKHRSILEKILGTGSEDLNEVQALSYADFLFSLEEEVLYVPDHSIAANARLKRQKGLFLISGSQERIATSNYHKLTIARSAKKEILKQLKKNRFSKKDCLCPFKEKRCKVCSCRNGFRFESVYGDLYGQSKAIKFVEDMQK
jgi:hypothetical protein